MDALGCTKVVSYCRKWAGTVKKGDDERTFACPSAQLGNTENDHHEYVCAISFKFARDEKLNNK